VPGQESAQGGQQLGVNAMAPWEADALHLASRLLDQVLNRLARRHRNDGVLVAVGQHCAGLGAIGLPARVGVAAAGDQGGHR